MVACVEDCEVVNQYQPHRRSSHMVRRRTQLVKREKNKHILYISKVVVVCVCVCLD